MVPPGTAFFDTTSARLGGSFGESDGGEITGKPGSCGDDEVVTDSVLIAVVNPEVLAAIGWREKSSAPLTELGGLVVGVELSSEGRGDRMEAVGCLSLSGLVGGGGILMLGLSIVVFVWEDCRWVAFRLGSSALLVAASKECETERPEFFNETGASLLRLVDDDPDAIAVKLLLSLLSLVLSRSTSVPLVEDLDREAMSVSLRLCPGACPHHMLPRIVRPQEQSLA